MRRGLHEITQAFVHTTMGGATRKAVKYEKKALKAALMNLRNMCADWAAGQSLGSMMDEDSIKSKAFKSSDHRDDYPDRAVPPSQTQLWLMRATARSLYDERSAHIKGTMLQEADLPKETVRMPPLPRPPVHVRPLVVILSWPSSHGHPLVCILSCAHGTCRCSR